MFDDSKLPIAAATRHPVTNEPILIKAGIKGYYPVPGLDVDTYNRDMKVTEAQLRAMEIGAIFGFDVPGADPDYHSNKGAKQ